MKAEVELKALKTELVSAIRETIQEEMMKIRAELIPYISDREQEEIDRLYDKPSRRIAKSRKYDLAD
jgi:predicted transcriptional regulator